MANCVNDDSRVPTRRLYPHAPRPRMSSSWLNIQALPEIYSRNGQTRASVSSTFPFLQYIRLIRIFDEVTEDWGDPDAEEKFVDADFSLPENIPVPLNSFFPQLFNSHFAVVRNLLSGCAQWNSSNNLLLRHNLR